MRTKYRLQKIVYFDAAHRLMRHLGACGRLHGHTYKVVITLEGEKHPRTGMVVDFGEVSERVGKWVKETFDHKVILNEEDRDLIIALMNAGGRDWIVELPGEPTAENLAQYILDKLTAEFGKQAVAVKVFETPNNAAVAEVSYEPVQTD